MRTARARTRIGGLLLAIACAAAPPAARRLAAQDNGVTLADAVRTALGTHPALRIQQEQVSISQGLQQQAAGRFDLLTSAELTQNRSNTPLREVERAANASIGSSDVGHQRLDVMTLGVGATKLLRNGLTLDLSSAVTRTRDNLTFSTGVSRSVTRAGATVPLAGGRGRAVVTADERAIGAEVRADGLDLQQTAAAVAANAVTSYWSLAAAKAQLAIAAGSEERGRRLHENVQTLIAADRSPRDDIHNVAANLAARTGTRIAIEQRVFERRRALAIDMGLDAGAIDTFPDTAEALPDPHAAAPGLDAATVRCYVEMAMRDRGDVRAAAARLEGAEARVVATRDLLRPRVDARMSLGYTGMSQGPRLEDYLAGIGGARGLDVQFGIVYAARSAQVAMGELLEAQARAAQARLRRQDLDREVRSSVVVALSAVHNSVARLHAAAASVDSFRQALEGQQEKLRLGVASVVELLTVEDRLTNALFQLTDAQLAYPLALVQLRLVTGAITSATHPTEVSDPRVWFELPVCAAPIPGRAAAAEPSRRASGRR